MRSQACQRCHTLSHGDQRARVGVHRPACGVSRLCRRLVRWALTSCCVRARGRKKVTRPVVLWFWIWTDTVLTWPGLSDLLFAYPSDPLDVGGDQDIPFLEESVEKGKIVVVSLVCKRCGFVHILAFSYLTFEQLRDKLGHEKKRPSVAGGV